MKLLLHTNISQFITKKKFSQLFPLTHLADSKSTLPGLAYLDLLWPWVSTAAR